MGEIGIICVNDSNLALFEFIYKEKSLVYIKNNEGPRIEEQGCATNLF